MTFRSTDLIPGSDAYWADRRAAFRLIADLEAAIEYRRRAPLYIAGPGYNPEDGEGEVLENIGPWDRVADLQDEARSNATVVGILTAQQRLDRLTI